MYEVTDQVGRHMDIFAIVSLMIIVSKVYTFERRYIVLYLSLWLMTINDTIGPTSYVYIPDSGVGSGGTRLTFGSPQNNRDFKKFADWSINNNNPS